MLKQSLKILILLSVFMLFEKCAQVVPLSGGKRDEKPPVLIEALPVNKSNNFNGTEIILKFNEYIQFKDLKNQLIISPGFKTDPELSVEGKKIKITLKKDELLPNTTYRIYFGKSVADMTEGNAIPDFDYIFSTGTYIDTLKVKGKVSDAFNSKNAGGVIVGLYTDDKVNADSLPYKNVPDYISRADNNGIFNFSYLPKKTFKVLAFFDKNKNYKYDGESEKIAFRDENLKLDLDTSINLTLFQEEPSKTFIKKTVLPYYGKALIIYNRKSVFEVKALNKEDAAKLYEPDPGFEKDSISIYYKGIEDTLKITVTNLNNKKTDTLSQAVPKLKINKPKTLTFNTNVQTGILNQGVPLQFVFFNLMDSSKTNFQKMQLHYKKDTIRVIEAVSGTFISPFKLQINNKLAEGITYKLKIDTARFFDVNGKYNDSLNISFKLQSKTELGKVTLKLLLNKKQAYTVQLINDKEQVIKTGFISLSLSSSNSVSIEFTGVPPGTYLVKVLFDDNENKKWDTGNYLFNKQPEKVIISSKQIKVMSDWDVEEEILVK